MYIGITAVRTGFHLVRAIREIPSHIQNLRMESAGIEKAGWNLVRTGLSCLSGLSGNEYDVHLIVLKFNNKYCETQIVCVGFTFYSLKMPGSRDMGFV
jgi:hypothetical protein